MDAELLAYTPHPKTAKPRVSVLAVAAVAGQPAAATHQGVALCAVGAVAVGSVMLALMGAPRTASGGVLSENAGRMFASSERRAVVTPSETPSAPVEQRASSPLPFAGSDIATGDSLSSAASGSASPAATSGSLDQAIANQGAAGQAAGQQQFRALTSFDGNMTMTSGGVQVVQPAQAQPEQRLGYVPPAPVVWNNPVKWISVHKDGL